ncbi:MAG: methionyl-tRNA formyltransferase [Deltaproteobacteria bacterium]|nr:methionyl-tRNA formyltransferase [Deltaproteobacteria bacterium]
MALRIVLFGQAAFAEKVLQGLIARGDDVAAVYCAPDAGGKPDPLASAARAAGIPCHQPPSYKTEAVRAGIAALAPELIVLAYVTLIVPEAVIAIPTKGAICFHPSLLPRRRGGSAINWTLIEGDPKAGITVFWTDAGIDTGPILLQREIEVGPDDSAGALYYQRIFPAGVELVLESVALIDAGRAPRLPQDEARASYEPLCRDPHAAIDWTKPAQKVHDLIRGCDPQPGAHTAVGEKRLRLYDSRRVEGDGAPGAILAVGPEGMTIATGAGAVRPAKARIDGTKEKLAAAEIAATLGLGVGSRLG